jgi:hypothetical protein
MNIGNHLSTCRVPWSTPPPEGIPADFAMGGVISSGTILTGFTRDLVNCTERCESYRAVIFCDHRGRLYAPAGSLHRGCKRRPECGS